jgi:hypothetical protein
MRDQVLNASLEGSGWTARTDAQGGFTIQSLPPGDYRLSVRAPSGPPAVLDLWAQTDVAVRGSDVDGVGLALAPGSTISGRIVFDGTKAPAPQAPPIYFVSADSMAMLLSGGSPAGPVPPPIRIEPDGSFVAAGLPPDRYLALLNWPGMRTDDGLGGWWLTSIRVGDRDIGDAPIVVEPNTNVRDVTLTFRDRIGVVEGMLTDANGRPAPEYFVLAFSADRSSWTTTSRRKVEPARPGTDGRYRLAGLLAGDYYVAVVTVADDNDIVDARFLEALIPMAIRMSIADGETRRQDLKIGR